MGGPREVVPEGRCWGTAAAFALVCTRRAISCCCSCLYDFAAKESDVKLQSLVGAERGAAGVANDDPAWAVGAGLPVLLRWWGCDSMLNARLDELVAMGIGMSSSSSSSFEKLKSAAFRSDS